MKNGKIKLNKTKLIARVMLVVLLFSSALNLAGCGFVEYHWEGKSHQEFVEYIKKYTSRHDLYVNTFISFDLDNHDEVSERIYYLFSIISTRARRYERNHGYICDIHEDGFGIKFLYYLRSDNELENDRAYKIKCSFTKVPFNFTENDKIEFTRSECNYYNNVTNSVDDFVYEKSFYRDGSKIEEEDIIYNHQYHYSLYVNDSEACCIHISSIDEASEEKLANIIQMLSDSMVLLNTAKFIIWQNKK